VAMASAEMNRRMTESSISARIKRRSSRQPAAGAGRTSMAATSAPPAARRQLKAQQTRDFDCERTVEQIGHAAAERVAAIAIDDEELAAGLIFPVQPHAGRQGTRGTVVLHQAADEHARRRRDN